MGKRVTTQSFIQRAQLIHGDKYDYSLVDYTIAKNKIIIICSIHGQFTQIPAGHLLGYGCYSCYGNIPLTTQEFIDKAKLVHDDKYNYSRVIYKNRRTKIIIICKIHGEFKQNPLDHLGGDNCKKCYYFTKTLTTEEFIQKAQLIHGDKYNYSLVKYKNAKTKVIIICKTHGEFKINSANHLNGQGCKDCSTEKMGWNHINWKKRAFNSKYFDSFKVYIIRCWNKNEEFYKVGKTFTTIECRFKHQFPYQYEIIKIFESKTNAEKITKLEKQIQNKNNQFKYVPKIKFNGMTECFSKI